MVQNRVYSFRDNDNYISSLPLFINPQAGNGICTRTQAKGKGITSAR